MGIIRKTKSVKTLLHIFEQINEAISVVELVERLQQEMNKTTVYRILERLELDGILHSFMDKDGLRWYANCNNCNAEQHTNIHPHFQCSKCGKVECLPFEVVVPAFPNRKVDSAEFLLVGECGACIA